jgi:hypothetical protein
MQNVFIIMLDGYISTHKVISSAKYRLLLIRKPKNITLHLVKFANCKFPFVKSCCNLIVSKASLCLVLLLSKEYGSRKRLIFI